MKILTAKQMSRLDRLSIRKHKIPAVRLMGRAAKAGVEVLLQKLGGNPSQNIVVVCGPGNNGGDGFAMTHLLRKRGYTVSCYFFGKRELLSPEAGHFYDLLQPKPLSIKSADSLRSLQKDLKNAVWVVDALFGTGLNRPLTGFLGKIVGQINRSHSKILAVDMPSGVSGDTGKKLGHAVRAHITVTFEVPKWGQVQRSAWDYVGELVVRPIGLKKSELESMKSPAQWLEEAKVKSWFRPRMKDMNKGKAGKLLIVAGSKSMPGAGYLTALGALRSGAGLVTWALPEALLRSLDLKFPEVILRYLPSHQGGFGEAAALEVKKLCKTFQGLAVGPGMGQGPERLLFLEGVLKKNKIPKILDADALNGLSQNPRLLRYLKGAVLTPHPKEMSRLLGIRTEEIMADRLKVAGSFAKKHSVWLVLKSYRSVIASPKGQIFLNSVGGPNLAVAGSGDVLTGIIGSLLSQGMSTERAVLGGVYLHGRAGDRLAQRLGDRGTLASEIANEVPLVIQELLEGRK